MLHAAQIIDMQHRANISPHTPVQLMARLFACQTYGLQILRPEVIRKQRVIGPIQQPPKYAGTLETLRNAQAKITNGGKHKAHHLLDHAYSSWARNA